MTTEIAIQQTHVLPNFSPDDIVLIRDTICKGATETEFKLFINQARATGLNPLARQVFAVKRWDQSLGREAMSIQVSIDGFRLIAERTGQYAGQTPPQWCGQDGVWVDAWLSDKPPSAARIGVLKHNFTQPCYATARFNAYAQRKKDGSLTSMWAKMGDVMIAKCAEALALRKAFPQELSGLYTADEMAQSTSEEVTQAVIEQPKSESTPEQLQLAEDAKKYVEEIGLCDRSEKLEKVVSRYAMTMAKLAAHLPKWHAKLYHILNEKRVAFEQQPTDTGEPNKAAQQPMQAGAPPRDELAEALGDTDKANLEIPASLRRTQPVMEAAE